jgi:hypothetical protein
MYCKKCGNVIQKEDRFCTGCGESAPDTVTAGVKTAPPTVQPSDGLDIDFRFIAAFAAGFIVFTVVFIVSLIIPALSEYAGVIAFFSAAICCVGTFFYINSLEELGGSSSLDWLKSKLTLTPTGGPAKRVMDRLSGRGPRKRQQ